MNRLEAFSFSLQHTLHPLFKKRIESFLLHLIAHGIIKTRGLQLL